MKNNYKGIFKSPLIRPNAFFVIIVFIAVFWIDFSIFVQLNLYLLCTPHKNNLVAEKQLNCLSL